MGSNHGSERSRRIKVPSRVGFALGYSEVELENFEWIVVRVSKMVS